MSARVVERAPDGTPLYAPRGELVIEAGGERVLCHLCGRAYRDLAASHVYRAHGIDPDAYRVLSVDGSRLGTGRALLFRARREARVRALGFGDLSAYYRSRY